MQTPHKRLDYIAHIRMHAPPKISPTDAKQWMQAAAWGFIILLILLILTGNGLIAAALLVGWVFGMYTTLMQMLSRRVDE
jgi:hypothetical protein